MDPKLFDYVGNLDEFMECIDSGEYDEYAFIVTIRLINTSDKWWNTIYISDELLNDQPENLKKIITGLVSHKLYYKELVNITFSKEYTNYYNS